MFTLKSFSPAAAAVLALSATLASGAGAQQPPGNLGAAQTGTTIEKVTGVWVEGPGFDVTYGGTADGCSQRCLGNTKCVMIEYYRPEKKCNLYSEMRPRKSGGSSIVGIRR
jgi:hypothetical protein